MADAARPEQYAPLVEGVDLLYQDVAQPEQAGIALRNCPFLKPGGILVLMLKTRSVDVRKEPAEVFKDTYDVLISAGLVVQECVWLAPYHHDHAAIVCTKPIV
jgi:fibrillarin-like pre-rRNA processing protein